VTFTRRHIRDLARLLSGALKTRPRFREQWKDVGSVEYVICDWDDPTVDDNSGFVSIDSGKKVMRINIRTDPRNSGVNLGTNDVPYELERATVSEFLNILQKAIASSELEKDTGAHDMHPGTSEAQAQDAEKRREGDKASGRLRFLEVTYKKESEFLVGSGSDGTRIFIVVGFESGLGADCDVQFDNRKTELLVKLLREAVRIARGATEDWERVGYAPYSMCDWDDWPLEDVRGFVIVDARKGRIRLIIRADARTDDIDWPIVVPIDTIEELIATLERTSPVAE
jgi:hypothetical protein